VSFLSAHQQTGADGALSVLGGYECRYRDAVGEDNAFVPEPAALTPLRVLPCVFSIQFANFISVFATVLSAVLLLVRAMRRVLAAFALVVTLFTITARSAFALRHQKF
jgi:hypothetical protein